MCVTRIHLHEALLIAQYNVPQKGDQGGVARVQRRLAELHLKKCRVEEGQTLQREAESVRRQLQGDQWKDLEDSEASFNLLVSCYYI